MVSFDILEPELDFNSRTCVKAANRHSCVVPLRPIAAMHRPGSRVTTKEKKHEKTKSVLSGVLEEDTV